MSIGRMMNGLTALVTGSTAGIGLGITKTLAARGCSIIVTGLGSQEKISNSLTEVKNAAVNRESVQFVAADLNRPEEIQSLCDEALRLHPKGVDILVNNAGIVHRAAFEDFSLDMWDDIIRVNLTAPFLLTKLLLPKMKENNFGRIVNIASVHGLVGSTPIAPYTAAKHGLVGLTKVVALDTAQTGITCNAVCPGWVPSDIATKQIEDTARERNITEAEAREFLLQRLPSKTAVEVEEVAEMVAYLSSPIAISIRGAAIPIDGGWVAQ